MYSNFYLDVPNYLSTYTYLSPLSLWKRQAFFISHFLLPTKPTTHPTFSLFHCIERTTAYRTFFSLPQHCIVLLGSQLAALTATRHSCRLEIIIIIFRSHPYVISTPIDKLVSKHCSFLMCATSPLKLISFDNYSSLLYSAALSAVWSTIHTLFRRQQQTTNFVVYKHAKVWERSEDIRPPSDESL